MLQLDPTHGFASAGAALERRPDGQRLRLGLPHRASEEQIRDATQAWLMRQARALFEQDGYAATSTEALLVADPGGRSFQGIDSNGCDLTVVRP